MKLTKHEKEIYEYMANIDILKFAAFVRKNKYYSTDDDDLADEFEIYEQIFGEMIEDEN